MLVDNRCASSGESMLNFLRCLDNVVIIGSTSAGYQLSGNVHSLYLPNTGMQMLSLVASFLVVAAPRIPLCPPWSFRSNLWSSQKLHDNLYSKHTLGIDIFLPFRVHFYFSINVKLLYRHLYIFI